MKRWWKYVLLIIITIACSQTAAPKHKPKHEVEQIVLKFVENVKNDVYKDELYFFEADTEFTTEDREFYFRRLTKYIKNNSWNLYLTAIDIYDGNEDAADVILKSKSGNIIIFCLGYWYDTKKWELDAYEFPGLTFYRPEDQSYDDYVKEITEEIKNVGVEYGKKETIEREGTYFIEYK